MKNYRVSGLCPSSGIINNRKRNDSEIGTASRMPSSGMLRHVALVRTDVSEKCRLLQERHGVTSQKTALHSHRRENFKSYMEVASLSKMAIAPYWTARSHNTEETDLNLCFSTWWIDLMRNPKERKANDQSGLSS
jgi:hypothetical protein